jgi:hypothetical protein
LENFEIKLSETERKHLIITGRNGSGKTSVLEVMRDYLQEYGRKQLKYDGTAKYNGTYRYDGSKVNPCPPIEKINIICNSAITTIREIISLYIPANKDLEFLFEPVSIEKVDVNQDFGLDDDAGSEFLQYMVHLDYMRLYAEKNGDISEKKRIDDWFNLFLQCLRDIFDCPDLKLNYDAKEYRYTIMIPDHEPFRLTELADGYAAFLKIMIELIMRMEKHTSIVYDFPGIVLVDEIEAHLHVELQKKILPFLTKMFPNIQFIVTTHSPFVITSLENAVICDLEKRIVTQDLSAYSYDGIIEYYYDSDKYSQKIKSDFQTYKYLINKQERTTEENEQLVKLIVYLNNIPSLGAPELMSAFRKLEVQRKSRNGKN